MDIKGLVIEKLSGLFPELEVYGEFIEQGFCAPCFFVQLVSCESKPYPSGRMKRTFQFSVRYYPVSSRPERECQEMAARLMEGLEFLPDARASHMEWGTTEQILCFSVAYTLFYRAKQELEPMEKLKVEVSI